MDAHGYVWIITVSPRNIGKLLINCVDQLVARVWPISKSCCWFMLVLYPVILSIRILALAK